MTPFEFETKQGVQPDWRWGLALAGFVLMVVALLAPGNVSLDGDSMLAVGRSLTSGHGFQVACQYGIHGRGGNCYSVFYPLQSVLAVPAIASGRAVASAIGGPRSYVDGLFAMLIPALAAAGTAVFTSHFARRLGASRTNALLAGATMVFATELAIYFRTFYAESLAVFLTCLVVWAFLRDDRWRWLAPIGIVLLILAKPQLVFVGLAVAAVLAYREWRIRPLAEAVAGTVVGSALYGAYNLLRFSSASNFGGDSRAVHVNSLAPWQLIKAAGELTISPGRGLIWYSPIVVLGIYAGIKRRSDTLAVLAFAVFGATLVLYLTNPGIGDIWADRYLAPVLPLFVALAWSLNTRALAPVLALLGVVIALPTFGGFYSRYYAEQLDKGVPNETLYWSVPKAPIFGVWGSTVHEIRVARHTDVNEIAKESDRSSSSGNAVGRVRFYKVVAQWWWMSPAGGVPRLFALVVALAMFFGGAFLLRLAGSSPRAPNRVTRARAGAPAAP
jgi:hypothetical protein